MSRDPLHTLSTENGSDDSSLLRTLIDSLPEQVYVKDTEGRYVLNNLAHVRALGAASPEEIAGKSDSDFYPEELAERYRADEREVIRSGRPLIDKEEPSVDGEGNERQHSATKVPLRDGDGEIVGLVGTTRDVTYQKEAEEALKESEERFRTAFEDSPIGVALVGLDGRRFRVNQALCEMLGYSEEELCSEKYLENIHPDDRQISSKHRLETLEKGEGSYILERRYVHADGHTVWNLTSVSLIQDSQGNPSHLVCLHQDITERKEVETKLRKSEARLSEAQRIARLGSWEWNVKTGEVFWSDETFRIYGYEPKEFEPTVDKLMELVHPDDRELVRKNIDAALYEGESYDFEHRIVRPDGEERVVHRQAEVLFEEEEEGEPLWMIGTVHDITERKQAEKKLRESEERFRSLIQNASDLITVLEEDGTIRYESPTIERILGYLPEERIGKNAFDYLHPDDEGRSKATFAEALENPSQVQPPVEFRLRHKDGSWRYMETTRTNLLDDPAVKGVVSNSRDITERKRAEEKIRESEERYRAVVEQSAEAIWLFDPDTKRVLESNTAFQEMLGYTSEELKEMTNYDFVSHSRQNIDSAIQRIVQERKGFFGERKYRRKDGTVLDVEVSGSVIPYQGKEVVCGVARDLTERKEIEEQLRHQAFHDSLTELPNRALFLNRLGHALARAKREGGPVAILLMDLDKFKVVNDSLGHDAGNAVLVEVAKRLRACMRPGDTAGRIFGDEFAVLLEAPSGMEEASHVAERLQEGLQAPVDVDGQEVFVKPSIGIALGESPEDRPEEVLRHADLAMYEAKSRGRAEYEVYRPSMNTRVVKRMDLETELRRAVEHEEFEVHYQPVIELETDRVTGFEALARWRHPERRLVVAEEFIELAEETGLIRPIGQQVVKEACRQAKEWRERCPDKVPWMSVNFSASQFSRQPDLIPKVLNEIGLDPNALQLEITERAVMDDAEYSIGKLKKLKGLGVSLAIDDYGMGYSCLYYLKRMPLDFLKIDRSFITGLGEDHGDEAIVAGTISLAHALGLKVVAEGVETEEQLAKLKELGCDLAQGFYLAEPLPNQTAEKLLVESAPF